MSDTTRSTSRSVYRPRYHLLPEANWMNDPNGPIFWRGRYRMFYQHNPSGPLWGNIHWGYASSPDMVQWTRGQPALAPGPEAYDAEGVFSGCAVEVDGLLHLYYTGNAPQTQCLAFANLNREGNLEIVKHLGNPIISSPPPGYDTPDFRDPFVWREGGMFRMIVASGHAGRGILFSYCSSDGISWEYEGEFFSQQLPDGVPALECPVYFRLEGREYLLHSPFSTPVWIEGRTEGTRFLEHSRGLLDGSPTWYAPHSFSAEDGRQIVVAWLREERPDSYLLAEGWAGCFSLPREVFPRSGGGLGFRPARELEGLRVQSRDIAPARLEQGTMTLLSPSCAQEEIDLEFEWEPGSAVELSFFDDGTRRAILSLDTDLAVLDASTANARLDILPVPKRMPLGENRNRLSLRVFLDQSTIEVFVDEDVTLSTRVYPEDPTRGGAYVRLRRGACRILRGSVHRMTDAVQGEV